MNDRSRSFIAGGARPLYVLALMAATAGGSGYAVRHVTVDQAQALSASRNRYEDLMMKYVDLAEACSARGGKP